MCLMEGFHCNDYIMCLIEGFHCNVYIMCLIEGFHCNDYIILCLYINVVAIYSHIPLSVLLWNFNYENSICTHFLLPPPSLPPSLTPSLPPHLISVDGYLKVAKEQFGYGMEQVSKTLLIMHL